MNSKKYRKPSKTGVWVLDRFLRYSERDTIAGDFEEYYYEKYDRYGFLFAYLWFWVQVVKSLPSFLRNSMYRSVGMFKSYLKISVRNMRKNKVYSFINVSGLAVGMAACTLFMLYIHDEFSWEEMHKNADNIYSVYMQKPGDIYNGTDKFGGTSIVLGPKLVEVLPEVLSSVRVFDWFRATPQMIYKDKKFIEYNIFGMDANAFEVFTFPLLSGEPESVLRDPYSIVISESTAKKYFGDSDPMNEVMSLVVGQEQRNLTVSGVFKDITDNTVFSMDIAIRIETVVSVNGREMTDWGYKPYATFVQLAEGTDHKVLESKLPDFIENYADLKHIWEHEGKRAQYFLTPLKDLHFRTGVNQRLVTPTDKRFIYLLSALAFLILLIACANYINLATAKSVQRSKEVGIRKVVGAFKLQLIKQFLSEAVVITFIALVLSLILVKVLLPEFNALMQKELTFYYSENIQFVMGIFALFMFIGLLAGSYPALQIAAFNPVAVLKGSYQKSSGGSLLRNILVVGQFSVSIILIFSTIVVSEQLNFIKTKDVGYNRDQIVVVYLRDEILREKFAVIKEELSKNAEILNVSASNSLPHRFGDQNGVRLPDKGRFDIYRGLVDNDFIDLFEMNVIKGQKLSESNSGSQIVLNEAAVEVLGEVLGWDDPIGQIFEKMTGDSGTVVGVVKDFNMNSLHQNVEPAYLMLRREGNFALYLSIKISGNTIPETIEYIENTFAGFSTKYPFSYTFLDDRFNNNYRAEQRIGNIFGKFSLLAILVACLGLFGLASFTAAQRTKELGIRKVLGASHRSIISILSMEFARWVLLANAIAWPVGYYVMNNWLQNFAFRMELSVTLFLYAGAFALGIAFITVSYQTLKVAFANPVDSLRYD